MLTYLTYRNKLFAFDVFRFLLKMAEELISLKVRLNRRSARWSYPTPPSPPPGNFADIPYLKEQSFLHRIRGVCTL